MQTAGLFDPRAGLKAIDEAIKVIWRPQSQQQALIACPVFEVFFGGARGGGKTEASLGDWMDHSNRYGEAAIGIFFRRKLVQLAEVIARSKQLFKKLGASYNEQQKTWTMKNGARLKFAYLERDEDAEEYQGHNYTRIYIEEVTNFPSPAPINKLRATLRSAAGVPVGMRLTGNPGGPGHQWVKARYIDPAPLGYKIIAEETDLEYVNELGEQVHKVVRLSRVFIPSKLQDNIKLLENDPTYVLRLRQSGSEQLVRAWLEGDWSVIDGAFFDEWSNSVHVLPPSSVLPYIPGDALIFKSFDWGSARPFSCGWWAISNGRWALPDRPSPPYGAMVRIKEWYGCKGPNEGLKMSVEDVAEGIKKREETLPWNVAYGVADPAIWIRNGGPAIGETMAKLGVEWRRGDNKRIPGAQAVRSRLHHTPDQPPLLYVLSNCVDTIRTLPTLQHDEKDPEDLDTDHEDHAYDDIRYACMSRPLDQLNSQTVVGAGIRLRLGRALPTINELIELSRKARKAVVVE